MKKLYQITEEEFEAIKKAIEETLHLWNYDFISASDEDEASISMSKEKFFEQLKKEFIVII